MSGGYQNILWSSAIVKLQIDDYQSYDYLSGCHMPGGFQNQVFVQPAVAVAGDFASANPYATFDAGAGGLVSGASGLTVGAFAWVAPPHDPDGTASIASNTGVGNTAGFVHRHQQALITAFLGDATQLIPQGFPVALMTQGDFWVKNSGATVAIPGQKAFANFNNGLVTFAASGSGPSATVTGSIGAQSLTFNGSINGDVLTVTAMGSGSIATGLVVGTIVSGGTGVTTGSQITSQLTGTTGSVGTYLLNFGDQTVAAAQLTGTYGLLTIASVTSGTLGIGQTLTGTAGGGVTANTTITQLGTATGGAGTYYVNLTGTVAVGSVITGATGIETKWYCVSTGQAGELVKISSWVGSLG